MCVCAITMVITLHLLGNDVEFSSGYEVSFKVRSRPV